MPNYNTLCGARDLVGMRGSGGGGVWGLDPIGKSRALLQYWTEIYVRSNSEDSDLVRYMIVSNLVHSCFDYCSDISTHYFLYTSYRTSPLIILNWNTCYQTAKTLIGSQLFVYCPEYKHLSFCIPPIVWVPFNFELKYVQSNTVDSDLVRYMTVSIIWFFAVCLLC